jgi:anti-sigma regulatory factor (Ser/Thr protein kinase)
MLPEDYGVPKDRCLRAAFYTVEDVIGFSRQVQDFCIRQGIEKKRSLYAALCTEEMAVNVITHGFTNGKQTLSVRLFVERDHTLTLRFRDDGTSFDLIEFRKLTETNTDDPAHNIGIRIVFGLAKKVNYYASFKMNNTVIEL